MTPHIEIPDSPRRGRFRVRTLMLIVAAAGLLAWMCRDGLMLLLLLMVLGTVLVMLAAMALGALGFGIAYVVEHLFARRKPKRLDL